MSYNIKTDSQFIKRLMELRFTDREVISIEPATFRTSAESYTEHKTVFFGKLTTVDNHGSIVLRLISEPILDSSNIFINNDVLFDWVDNPTGINCQFIGYKIVLNDPLSAGDTPPPPPPPPVEHLFFTLRKVLIKNNILKAFGYAGTPLGATSGITTTLYLRTPSRDIPVDIDTEINIGTFRGIMRFYIQKANRGFVLAQSPDVIFDIPYDNDPLEAVMIVPRPGSTLYNFVTRSSGVITLRVQEWHTYQTTNATSENNTINFTTFNQITPTPRLTGQSTVDGDLGIIQDSTLID